MCSISVVLLQDLEQNNLFMSLGPWKTSECVQAWRQKSELRAAFVKLKEVYDEIETNTMKSVLIFHKAICDAKRLRNYFLPG
jgi:heme-degrading monooxygenase HmoA